VCRSSDFHSRKFILNIHEEEAFLLPSIIRPTIRREEIFASSLAPSVGPVEKHTCLINSFHTKMTRPNPEGLIIENVSEGESGDTKGVENVITPEFVMQNFA
jgi:hypothetical protein